jgi:hypothetical protein
MRNGTSGRERGEGKLGGILSLALIAAFVYAVWNVAPPFMADFNLKDRMIQICRLGRGANPDEAITEKLMSVVKEEELTDFIGPRDFKITTRDTSRRIVLEYERTLKILPGFKKTWKFSHDVDEPIIF